MNRTVTYFLCGLLVCFSALFAMPGTAQAQGAAGTGAEYETQKIITMPTAGIIEKGKYSVDVNVFAPGGTAIDFNAGVLKNFSIGVAFSGSGIIGATAMRFQSMPGFSLKFRIIDEEKSLPAISLGFTSQGSGYWYKGKTIKLDSAGDNVEFGKRFQVMSPGFYVAASKSFNWALGCFVAHGGVNYSIEPNEDNKSINAYLGMEQTIGSRIAINGEYNFNLDERDYDYTSYTDGTRYRYMKQIGTLSAAFRYSISKGVTVSLEFHDILRNRNKDVTPYNGGQIERRMNLQMIKSF